MNVVNISVSWALERTNNYEVQMLQGRSSVWLKLKIVTLKSLGGRPALMFLFKPLKITYSDNIVLNVSSFCFKKVCDFLGTNKNIRNLQTHIKMMCNSINMNIAFCLVCIISWHTHTYTHASAVINLAWNIMEGIHSPDLYECLRTWCPCMLR